MTDDELLHKRADLPAVRGRAEEALRELRGYRPAQELLAAMSSEGGRSVTAATASKNLTAEERQHKPPVNLDEPHRPVWWCPPGVGGGAARTAMLLALLSIPVVGAALQTDQAPLWTAQAHRLLSAAWPPLLLVTTVWVALRWWTTWYIVSEKRVEVRTGILFRIHRGIWYYDIERPVFSRSNPWQTLTGTGTVVIESERLPARSLGFFFNYQKAGNFGQLKLAGFGNRAEIDQLVKYLTQQILRQRREVKATLT